MTVARRSGNNARRYSRRKRRARKKLEGRFWESGDKTSGRAVNYEPDYRAIPPIEGELHARMPAEKAKKFPTGVNFQSMKNHGASKYQNGKPTSSDTRFFEIDIVYKKKLLKSKSLASLQFFFVFSTIYKICINLVKPLINSMWF